MAIGFQKQSLIPGVQTTQAIQRPGSYGIGRNNIFIFANRRNRKAEETKGLPVIRPQSGYPRYEYYKCYELPEMVNSDGRAAASYLKSCGFDVEWGYSGETELPGVDKVDKTTLEDQGKVICYFTDAADDVRPLVGISVKGTYEDDTNSSKGSLSDAKVGSFIVSGATYDSYVVVKPDEAATVDVGDVLDITFHNNDIGVPDVTKTDPIIMEMFYACNAAQIPDAVSNPNRTLRTPRIWFSILPDPEFSGIFGPTTQEITLDKPAKVSENVITFSTECNNAYLIPVSELGNTKIKQGEASGIIDTGKISGKNIIITLRDVQGIFSVENDCTLKLDSSQTAGILMNKQFAKKNLSCQQIAMPYEIKTPDDITTKYAEIFNFVNELNQPMYSVKGQAIAQIVIARKGISEVEAYNTLPENVDSFQIEPVFYNYKESVGDVPLTAGCLAAAYAMVIGNNIFPINPQGEIVINGLPVKNNPDEYIDTAVNSYADLIMRKGWNVIAVNNNLKPYTIEPRTGQLTMPGTPTPDKEFFYEYVWQTIDYCRLVAIQYLQSLGMGQIRQTPTVYKMVKSELFSLYSDIADAGLIKAVDAGQIKIWQDKENPAGMDAEIAIQVTAGLINAYVKFNVFSSLVEISKEV